jgi:hypothetical protein
MRSCSCSRAAAVVRIRPARRRRGPTGTCERRGPLCPTAGQESVWSAASISDSGID